MKEKEAIMNAKERERKKYSYEKSNKVINKKERKKITNKHGFWLFFCTLSENIL